MNPSQEKSDLPPMSLKCPQCGKGTTSLKRYGVINYVLFLGIAARWGRGSFTACPKCVRKKMLKGIFSPLNILSANLMWLLAILPYNLGVMIASTIPGHSSAIRKKIEEKFGISVNKVRRETPPVDAETVRHAAIDAVLALKRENAPRISDLSFTSPTGYNYGRWADKGFNLALGLLRTTQPEAGEDGADYLDRVKEMTRVQRDEYRADDADEDGACSGALDAAMRAIVDAKQKKPQDQKRSEPSPRK